MENGVNLIGFLGADMGLGVAARNTATLLELRGVSVHGLEIDAGMGRSRPGLAPRGICVPDGEHLRHGINLWHLNPPEIGNLMASGEARIDWNRCNACVPFWELSCLPEDWFQALDAMDMILAPSRFIESAMATSLGSARIRHFPIPLDLPAPAGWDRQALGIPEGDMVFAASFDFGSTLERKNPLGVLEAFMRAFQGDPRSHLLLKGNNASMNAASSRLAAFLKEKFGAWKNIRILDRPMAYPEVLALYRCADAYVSLHRSEGLGLGLMECMALGKPVVGTGWSGNLEFMRDANSLLVRHRLVPVDDKSLYGRQLTGKQAVWAEPDLDDAVRCMRLLADNPGIRSEIGGRAAEAIRAYNAEARRGLALEDLFECRDRLEGGGVIRRREVPTWRLPVPVPA